MGPVDLSSGGGAVQAAAAGAGGGGKATLCTGSALGGASGAGTASCAEQSGRGTKASAQGDTTGARTEAEQHSDRGQGTASLAVGSVLRRAECTCATTATTPAATSSCAARTSGKRTTQRYSSVQAYLDQKSVPSTPETTQSGSNIYPSTPTTAASTRTWSTGEPPPPPSLTKLIHWKRIVFG
jgi:hypothetical protein